MLLLYLIFWFCLINFFGWLVEKYGVKKYWIKNPPCPKNKFKLDVFYWYFTKRRNDWFEKVYKRS